MTARGLGAALLGRAPFGLGSPASAPAISGGPLEDETGAPQPGRFLDPMTRQYRITVHGRIAGMPQVPQLMQLAFATVKGSSAFAQLGHDILSLEDIGDNFNQRAEALLTDAVAHLTAFVSIRSIDIQHFPSGAGATGVKFTVLWTDLTSGVEHSSEL